MKDFCPICRKPRDTTRKCPHCGSVECYSNKDAKSHGALRRCTVNGIECWFHGFYQRSYPVPSSPMIGGAPGGIIAYVEALVEYDSGETGVFPVYAVELNFMEDV